MYRPEIKVLDCTIRDGGLMNNWQFTDEFVRDVYQALVAAGVDYMEIGYKSSASAFSKTENGAWKFCEEEALRKIVGDEKGDIKLSAMADIGRIEPNDIAPKDQSLLDMIRVACYVNEVDKAIWLAEHCKDKGYETCINVMAVSTALERDLDEALNDLSKCKIPNIYLVDSFGSMYSEQIEYLARKYKTALPGKTIGIHAHNNMQLAFSNTVTAIIENCNMLDATMLGIGRGAGNCPIEILMSFLKNPKFNLRPILHVIEKHLIQMQREIPWGYYIPYMLAGAKNQHPRVSMKWVESEKRDKLVDFFDSMVDGMDI